MVQEAVEDSKRQRLGSPMFTATARLPATKDGQKPGHRLFDSTIQRFNDVYDSDFYDCHEPEAPSLM